MGDSLLELLLSDPGAPSEPDDSLRVHNSSSAEYLSHLSSLPLSSLASSEKQSVAQSSHSLVLSLQALSSRSHRAVTASCDHLSALSPSLSSLLTESRKLRDAIPRLDETAVRFSQSYTRDAGNELLERRRKAMLLARNVDRLSDILDMPSLLSTAISSGTPPGTMNGSQAIGPTFGATSYSAALDLYMHIKRLHSLYPYSPLVSSLTNQAGEAMQRMTTNLIAGLRAPGLKLAGAMRMIGWLRRVAPELDDAEPINGRAGDDGGLGTLFLACRLANLRSMLEALEPLRELAEQETDQRLQYVGKNDAPSRTGENAWSVGQHTERFLKRYIETFREQSFGILSMYRSIFPSFTLEPYEGEASTTQPPFHASRVPATPKGSDPLRPLPSPLCTVPLQLVCLLTDVLQRYLPNIQDRTARESLLTQVLYCAGSLGRLGADFSLVLASLSLVAEEEPTDIRTEDSIDWVHVMKKHRALAGRLDLLASGVNVPEPSVTASSQKA